MDAPRLLPPYLVRTWREPPAVATPRVLARTTGFFYVTGGSSIMIGTLLLGSAVRHPGWIVAIAISSMLTGLGVMASRGFLPKIVVHALTLSGTALITMQVVLAGGGVASAALSTAYLYVIVIAAFLFPLRSALAHVIVAEVAAAWALIGSGVSAGAVVMIAACALSVTVVVGWLGRLSDIAEQDPLTLLANRRGFDRRLETVLREPGATSGGLALALLDVDLFKSVNDRRGHLYGDQMLVDCADAWRRMLPEDACLSRYGGDEFALLLPGYRLGGAADLADQLRAATPSYLTVSVGVAAWEPGDSGSILMSRADVALYQAKSTGRDRTVAHGDPARAASELESAIAAGQLIAMYQPIVQLSTREPVGYESLVRWQHPRRGLVMPDEFIAQAERTGAIHSLGAWLVDEVCRAVVTGPGPRRSIGINVSPVELANPDYADMVIDRMEAYATPGNLLVLEVTEGAFDEGDEQVLKTLCTLRDRGILVAIDDFGAGHSSLSRLESLPIDVLKVDGALVQAIGERDDSPILAAIAAMAHALDLRLVAERVETEHQAAVLKRLGYQLAQGYLFGRPAPR